MFVAFRHSRGAMAKLLRFATALLIACVSGFNPTSLSIVSAATLFSPSRPHCDGAAFQFPTSGNVGWLWHDPRSQWDPVVDHYWHTPNHPMIHAGLDFFANSSSGGDGNVYSIGRGQIKSKTGTTMNVWYNELGDASVDVYYTELNVTTLLNVGDPVDGTTILGVLASGRHLHLSMGLSPSSKVYQHHNDREVDETVDPSSYFAAYLADPRGTEFQAWVYNHHGGDDSTGRAPTDASGNVSKPAAYDPTSTTWTPNPYSSATGAWDNTKSPTTFCHKSGSSISNPVVISPGGVATFVASITTPKVPAKPDVVFLADTTGSMGGAIANVRAKASTVMGQIRTAQPDARFGVAEYKDFNCDATPYRLDQSLTTDTARVLSAITSSWQASGGCDTPEAQLNALFQLATDVGTVGWRPDGVHVIAWFGDAPGHDPSNGHSLGSVLSALQANKNRVVAVNVSDLDGCNADPVRGCSQATAITAATNGRLLSLTSAAAPTLADAPFGASTDTDLLLAATVGGPEALTTAAVSDDVADAILAGITSLPVVVAPKTDQCGSFVTVTPDAPSKSVVSGETVSFTFTARVAADLPSGVAISCAITFSADGLVITDPTVAAPLSLIVPLVDLVQPSATFTLDPAPTASGWNNSNVHVAIQGTDSSLSSIDDQGTGVTELRYSSIGAQTLAEVIVPGDSAALDIQSQGITSVSATATDGAGNKGSTAGAVRVDKAMPSCALTGTGIDATGHTYIQITVQDTLSGLGSVLVSESNNATVPTPAFTAGTTAPVIVTATKLNQSQSSQVALSVTDQAGNITNCDPILTEVGNDGPGGAPRSETFHHVARGESHLTITNGTPGLDRLKLVVNGQQFAVTRLTDGESRDLDVSAAMRRGNNTITITAQGKSQGTATILIADK